MINSEGRRNPDLGNRRRDDTIEEIADYDEKVRLTITLTPMILLILPFIM